jgi:hypothetical protein
MALTHLCYALADQSNPVAYQANSMDKRSTRSDDGPEQCLQVSSFAGFLLFSSIFKLLAYFTIQPFIK